MDITTKREMKRKLRELFYKKIEKFLPKYETKRKKATVTHFLLILCIIFGILIFSREYIPVPNEEAFTIFSVIGLFSSAILMEIANIILGNKKNVCGERQLQINLENELKQEFMKELLEIFIKNVKCGKNLEDIFCNSHTQFGYSKNIINLNVLFKFQKEMKALNIFNTFPFLIIDDCFSGTYENVKIKIYEASTKPTTILGSVFLTYFILMIFTFIFPFLILSIIFFPLLIITFVAIYKLFKNILKYSSFRGLIVEFNFEKNFTDETFFLDKSFASKRIKPNPKMFKEVNLESIYFEKQYQLYSNNQIEARYIFTPAFIEKINKIRDIFKTNKIRGSFKNNKLILTINTNKDMFALGDDFKKTDYRTFLNFYQEMISLLQLVDELKKYLK